MPNSSKSVNIITQLYTPHTGNHW